MRKPTVCFEDTSKATLRLIVLPTALELGRLDNWRKYEEADEATARLLRMNMKFGDSSINVDNHSGRNMS